MGILWGIRRQQGEHGPTHSLSNCKFWWFATQLYAFSRRSSHEQSTAQLITHYSEIRHRRYRGKGTREGRKDGCKNTNPCFDIWFSQHEVVNAFNKWFPFTAYPTSDDFMQQLTFASSSRPRAFNKFPRSLRTQYKSYNKRAKRLGISRWRLEMAKKGWKPHRIILKRRHVSLHGLLHVTSSNKCRGEIDVAVDKVGL